jgi:hypothetical protein
MKHQKILVILFYAVFILIYLLFSTNFTKGWTKKSVFVNNTRVSLLLFVVIAFIVLMIVILTPM